MEQEIVNSQENNLKNTIFDLANAALDFGIRAALPNFIEEDVIDIKNKFIKEGFSEGIQEIIKKASSYGTIAKDLISGNLSEEQIKIVIEKDGILDSISNLTEGIIKKLYETELINKNTYNLLKKGKKEIVNSFEKELKNRKKRLNNSQDDSKKIEEYIEEKGSFENLTENEKNLIKKLK